MNYVGAGIFSSILFASHAGATTVITLLLQFKNKRSARTVEEMKREMSTIMNDTGFAFDFRSLKDFNPNEPVTDLVETVCIPAFDPQRSAAVQRGGVRPGAGA